MTKVFPIGSSLGLSPDSTSSVGRADDSTVSIELMTRLICTRILREDGCEMD